MLNGAHELARIISHAARIEWEGRTAPADDGWGNKGVGAMGRMEGGSLMPRGEDGWTFVLVETKAGRPGVRVYRITVETVG